MKFVEETGANWAVAQLKVVEMEIEQTKREWEEKRQAERKLEEAARSLAEKEDNELLTYSREDASNKVNIKSVKKSNALGRQQSRANCNRAEQGRGKVEVNGTEKVGNGHVKEAKRKAADESFGRNTRNSLRGKSTEVVALAPTPPAKKPKRVIANISKPPVKQAKSENASETSAAVTPSESDSECSLDVMIDSNDVNDSDSNSNLTHTETTTNRFDSSSQDESTLMNDDDLNKTIKSARKSTTPSNPPPRKNLRSTGTVKIDLWKLDESPIDPKRMKLNKSISKDDEMKEEEDQKLKADFGLKECQISVVDIHSPILKPPEKGQVPTTKKKSKPKVFSPKNNHTLDKWVKRKDDRSDDSSASEKADELKVARPRRSALLNKTF